MTDQRDTQDTPDYGCTCGPQALALGVPEHGCPLHVRQQDVYHRFTAEVDALVIPANASAVWVVGELTRAVKRAQNAYDAAIGEGR